MSDLRLNPRTLLRLVTSYHDSWEKHFPGLFKRSHWLIAAHLCSKARKNGAPFSDLCEQVSWQDVETIKARVIELVKHELCSLDPNDEPITKHNTMVVPSGILTERFDQHLFDFTNRFVNTVQDQPEQMVDFGLDENQQRLVLGILASYRAAWNDAIEEVLAQHLSHGRRVSAKRKLLSTRHFTLLHSVVERHYEIVATSNDPPETSANEFGSILWKRIEQPYTTTFLHLNELVEWGFLARSDKKKFLVRIQEPIIHLFDAALTRVQSSIEFDTQSLCESLSRKVPASSSSGEQIGKIVVFKEAKISRSAREVPLKHSSKQSRESQ